VLELVEPGADEDRAALVAEQAERGLDRLVTGQPVGGRLIDVALQFCDEEPYA